MSHINPPLITYLLVTQDISLGSPLHPDVNTYSRTVTARFPVESIPGSCICQDFCPRAPPQNEQSSIACGSSMQMPVLNSRRCDAWNGIANSVPLGAAAADAGRREINGLTADRCRSEWSFGTLVTCS